MIILEHLKDLALKTILKHSDLMLLKKYPKYFWMRWVIRKL